MNKVTTWENIKMQNIPLDKIREDSEEYKIMKKAAENGDPSSQHSMGMWQETVACNDDEAKKWYKKAAIQGHEGAKNAFDNLVKKELKAIAEMSVNCTGDIINIADIDSVYTKVLTKHELEKYEQKCNGFYDGYRYAYTYEYKEYSEHSIDERTLERIVRILNKYWREISYYLPKPHESFLHAEKSSFEAISDSYSKFAYNITPEKYDVSILWKYHWRVNDPCGGHTGNKEKIISLRKDIYPTIKKIINLPPKTSREEKAEIVTGLIELALVFTGGYSLSSENRTPDISDEAKNDLKNIYNDLTRYYKEVDKKASAQKKRATREEKHDDFMLFYLGNSLLTIKTKQKQYEYLEEYCGFDIFAKEQEIKNKLAIYQEKKKQISVSDNKTTNKSRKSDFKKDDGTDIYELLLYTKKPLQYKNRPLVIDDGGTLWYGNKSDKFIIIIEIMGNVDNILLQLVDNKNQSTVLRQKHLNNLQKALDIGESWLVCELENSTEEKEKEKPNPGFDNENKSLSSDINYG